MTTSCQGCRDGAAFELPFSMAFQPIVDIATGKIFAHEALVRGLNGEGAGSVLSQVQADNRYAFDQQCRVKAIELAAQLYDPADDVKLSINFMPNAVYEPRACIRLTLATAMKTGFPLDRIIFEFTENEELDTKHVLHILRTYRDMGFKTAIDDFGSGHSGLGLLSHFQPDIVKLDMDMIRGIDTDPVRRTIVKHTLRMLEELNIVPLCEGVETVGEMSALRDLGVSLIQGYLLAKPSFEHLAIPASAKAMLAAAA
ncbi:MULTISPECIES: EAL domain-containing protein [Rhizobium/Agrobacterium group]|jgi:EAL domain-containing protein (putative c-di-GMP-specific phosphodiesterase class I)|uniref:EAL domain-containing protein (Putative c-di-GMP-specific phosphodiesterase class I) n=1 Tax=Rhizobium soli TaxID=424798 RepID=A0A7X0JQD4_9HYPH|nr:MULTISPECIES: EAL domain-containing protein [Rhizobium/Agrobacterium group]MBB6511002.1 EAL domain-containing protein (putative c-di-GMP-specific phosphodiesterase class I) [Rhizobium soli]MBP2459562.1 EAL domain-containing protein (putative c-di-GMP-specific phosphodiesterase class I) [Rhizobium sp. PvP014]MBP2531856.1 EAL domain-containing protein (putative c-di-GMP-specific phosphodiesterase class I) [Rhizobium sp. PvP099]NSY19211.1 EAL domain-containing protein [Neorhizobium sp. AL 9.2.2